MTEKEYSELIKAKPELAQKAEIKNINKYHNKKVYVYADGTSSEEKYTDKRYVMVFDSRKEYGRYLELKFLEFHKEISELSRQKNLIILENFEYGGKTVRGISYKADFYYKDKDGNIVVEDVKPFDKKKNKYITTKDFSIKWKLLKHKYPDIKFVLI